MGFNGNKLREERVAIYSWENYKSQPTPDSLLIMCEEYSIFDPLEYFGYSTSLVECDQNEAQMISNYRNLNDEGREKLLDYSDDLVSSGKYKKHNQDIMVEKEA